MKHFMIIAILASLFSGMAFAAETSTDCPMMREMNKRTNPKAGMAAKEIKKPRSSNTSKATDI